MSAKHSENGNGDIRFKIEDVKTIATLTKSLEHLVKDFEDEKDSREEREKRIEAEVQVIKEGYIPKWQTMVITALTSIIAIETTILISHFFGG